MLSSLLLHASAETLDPAAGPGLFALSLARDFGAHLRAPVFQLDVTSQPARQPASGDPELSDQKASALRSAAEEMGVSISVEIERRMSFGVPNWICDLAKLHDLTVAGVDPTGRCCQTNANSSPPEATLPCPAGCQPMMLHHSANAAERRVL